VAVNSDRRRSAEADGREYMAVVNSGNE